MATTISDFFVPELASQFFLQAMLEKSALIRAGIAQMTPELTMAASMAGKTVDVPAFNQVSISDAPSIATDGETELTPFDLSGNSFLARKNFRTASWKAPNIIAYTNTGLDPLTPALGQYAGYWASKDQSLLLAMLKGVFTTALSANAVNKSIAEGTAATAENLIGTDAVLDAQFVLGDAYSSFTGIAMHHVPFKRLASLDLITYEPYSVQNPTLMPKYLGLNVIVDSNLPVVAGATDGYVYTSYLFGNGAVGYAQVPDAEGNTAVELYREPTKGTGSAVTSLITRNYNIMAPLGCSFSGTPAGVSPTDAEYETSTNWTLAWSQKRIPIAQLKTNG